MPAFSYITSEMTDVSDDGKYCKMKLFCGKNNVMISDFWFQALFMCMEIEDFTEGTIANFHAVAVPMVKPSVQMMIQSSSTHEDICLRLNSHLKGLKSCNFFTELPKVIDPSNKIFHLVQEKKTSNGVAVTELQLQKEVVSHVSEAGSCRTTIKINPGEDKY
ncbi:hypothetical protein CSKR_100279, partial [Clonorchis sinensis]